MHQLVLRRRGTQLEAPSRDWAALLCELPEGVDLNIKATRARSIPQLGTYWGTISFVLKNHEGLGRSYATKDDLSDALQLAVGFVRQISMPGIVNGAYAVPRSKSFAECSQSAFNEYMSLSMDRLSEWCGFSAVDAYLQHMGTSEGVRFSDEVTG